jgi:phosphoenolpyruvate carboxykinase (ATP)
VRRKNILHLSKVFLRAQDRETAMDAAVGRQVLGGTGILEAGDVNANLGAAALVEHAIRRGEGRLSADGALMVQTGVHTGRSVQDKFVVDEPETSADVWWGKVNQKLAPAGFTRLCDGVRGHLQGRELSRRTSMPAPIPRTACASAW